MSFDEVMISGKYACRAPDLGDAATDALWRQAAATATKLFSEKRHWLCGNSETVEAALDCPKTSVTTWSKSRKTSRGVGWCAEPHLCVVTTCTDSGHAEAFFATTETDPSAVTEAVQSAVAHLLRQFRFSRAVRLSINTEMGSALATELISSKAFSYNRCANSLCEFTTWRVRREPLCHQSHSVREALSRPLGLIPEFAENAFVEGVIADAPALTCGFNFSYIGNSADDCIAWSIACKKELNGVDHYSGLLVGVIPSARRQGCAGALVRQLIEIGTKPVGKVWVRTDNAELASVLKHEGFEESNTGDYIYAPPPARPVSPSGLLAHA